jgi:long-chain acyl-CoA synthetase
MRVAEPSNKGLNSDQHFVPSGLNRYIDLMERWKDRLFLVGYRGYRKHPWRYSQTREAILILSNELKKRGVSSGSRVLLVGRRSPEWVIAFFAILQRGAVVIPLDPDSPLEFFLHIFKKTTPALIIGDEPSFEKSKDFSQIFIHFNLIETIVEQNPAPVPRASREPHDLAEIVFTSGTTSEPKGVMLSHRNILSILDPIQKGMEQHRLLVKLFPRIKMLCTVPYSHMFGQVTGIFLPILLGSTLYFTEETTPAAMIRAIKRDRILTLITVPRFMKLLADHVKNDLKNRGKYPRFEKRWERWVNLPWQMRVLWFLNLHRFLGLHFWSFIVGGAPLDPETHEFWRRTVFSVFQGYGLTETAPIVTMFNPFKHKRDSVGVVFPGQEVKVAQDGEILVKGQNIMTGYFDDPEGTSRVLEDGWFRTGDIGEIDAQGQVFIRGRKKDMILTSDGHNIYPVDIENVLNTEKGVRESVVIGKPGPSGESIHAVLLLESGANPERIIQNTNVRLGPHQRIRSYTLWKQMDFPRTPTMKIKKVDIEKKVLEQHGPEKAAGAELFDDLVAGEVNRNMQLSADLGLDSLDMVEVICRLEKKYGVSLDETLIGPDTTVGEIEALSSQPQKTLSIPMPRWTRKKPALILRSLITNGIILPFFRMFCKIEVQGLEELEKHKGARILCVNHESDLDPLALLLSLPLRYRKRIAPAMGLIRFHPLFTQVGRFGEDADRYGPNKKRPSFWKRFIYALAYYLVTLLFQAYPFPQGAAYRPSLEYTGELLDAGLWILIFPEGRVSETGDMNRFKGGISLLAEKTGVPVFPIGVRGMHEILPPGRRFPHRGRVSLSFGNPLYYGGQEHDEFTSQVEQSVRRLKSASD